MAIRTLDDVLSGTRQIIRWGKGHRSIFAYPQWSTQYENFGYPGAGAMDHGTAYQTSGVVPTSADVGYPKIDAFAPGAKGYLTRVDIGSSHTMKFALFDRLYLCGTYARNVVTTLSGQPSFAARLPGGSYVGTELWHEHGGENYNNALTITVGYVNQDGVTGRSTGPISWNGQNAYRCTKLPLQAGDTGIQRIDSIDTTGTLSGTGKFNLMILRPLWQGDNQLGSARSGLLQTGFPEVFASSALYVLYSGYGSASGTSEAFFHIVSR